MQKERQVRIRLDRLLVERGLAETRAKAQAMILAGEVLVDEQKVEKCGALASAEAKLRLLAEPLKYVGRGGVKLEGALAHFGVSAEGKTCLDIGASTGGFTDCLLRQGASRVFAVDVGTNQLDWKLRRDPRVVSLEKINARYLRFDQLSTRVALAVMDVSFISATLILPVLPPLLERRRMRWCWSSPNSKSGKVKSARAASCVSLLFARKRWTRFLTRCWIWVSPI